MDGSLGLSHERYMRPLPGAAVSPVGAEGGAGVGVGFALGVAVLDSEAGPAPFAFTALIRISTCTSFFSYIPTVPGGRRPQPSRFGHP